MNIHCLFDTNALMKYYVDLPGSDIVTYLIDKNPTVIANITNVQVAEMIAHFNKFRVNGVLITDTEREQCIHTFLHDIKRGKIKIYDFANEHLLDFDVYKKVAAVPASKIRFPYAMQFEDVLKISSASADTADIIMLLVMREMNLLSQGRSYLVTSDAHVKRVAHALELNVFDPERELIKTLPKELDYRRDKREKVNLNAICAYEHDPRRFPLMRTIDVSENGLCLEVTEPLEVEKTLSIKLSPRNNYYQTQEVKGQVHWSHGNRAGIKSFHPIDLVPLVN